MLYWGSSIGAIILLGGWSLARAFRLPRRLPPVPHELAARAVIPGMPGVRYMVGLDVEPLVRDVVAARQREEEYRSRSGHTGPLPPAEMLAISGGGDNGAFGAGLLCGWSSSGNRPSFKSVTGVSTGALIAPLAFLGSEEDPTRIGDSVGALMWVRDFEIVQTCPECNTQWSRAGKS